MRMKTILIVRTVTGGRSGRSPWKDRPGFALVAVLLMLVLLTVIALGLLSLSSISLRASTAESGRSVARANARLAMTFALGELQKHTGPDQRVTATAGILDSGPTQPGAIDGVQADHQYWTGVWRSNRGDDTPLVVRNDNAKGLQDLRPRSEWSTVDGKFASSLSWLVSGSEAGLKLDPRLSYDNRNGQEKVVTVLGSAGLPNAAEVKVPVVSVGTNGGYGWWVADQGVKADLAIDHPYKNDSPSAAAPKQNGYRWLTGVPGARPAAIDSAWEGLELNAGKIPSTSTIRLAASTFDRSNFHDYTDFSQGVLADTLRGGLRKDLSAYILGENTEPLPGSIGLNDQSNLIGPMDAAAAALDGNVPEGWAQTKHQKLSPRFALFKSWWKLNGQATTGATLRPPKSGSVLDDYAMNQVQTDLKNQTEAGIQPILVEGSVFYSFCYTSPVGTSANVGLRTLVYPRVVLWNPYNVKMTCPDDLYCLVRVAGNNRVVKLSNSSGATVPSIPAFSFPGIRSPRYGIGPSQGTWVFRLADAGGIIFEPGECKVFSKFQSGSQAYSKGTDLSSDYGNNQLSSKAYSSSASFYHDTTATLPASVVAGPGLRYQLTADGDYEDLGITLKNKNGASGDTAADITRMPTLQNVSFDTAAGSGSRKNNSIPWPSPLPVFEHFDLARLRPPFYASRDGIRLRWLSETGENITSNAKLFDGSTPIAQQNLRNSFHLRSPVDNVSAGSEPFQMGNYVRDIPGSASSWENTAPIPGSGGGFHGNPFDSAQSPSSSEKYILFDFPNPSIPITSLAQLQHVPVSVVNWQPSYAIGNSWADPASPLDGTSPPWSTEGGWNATNFPIPSGVNGTAANAALLSRALVAGSPGTYAANSVEDQLTHDLSYELNYQLWDRFFLSGGGASEVTKYLKEPSTTNLLANSRLREIVPAPGTLPHPAFHSEARYLGIIGAFNVNSTSVEAWKALLKSTRDKGPSGDSAGRYAYPRVVTSKEGTADTQGPTSPAAWSGYRTLDDAQVTKLAEEIVKQVKARGPFLYLSDFINRRLVTDEYGYAGPLQAAINNSGINSAHDAYEIDKNAAPSVLGTGLNQQAKAKHRSAGAPNYLQQADLLQPLAPVLSARSDTFLIRSYGEARDAAGEVVARAWCECVVQRTPEPLVADGPGLNPDTSTSVGKFGRKFNVVGFRWLHPSEV